MGYITSLYNSGVGALQRECARAVEQKSDREQKQLRLHHTRGSDVGLPSCRSLCRGVDTLDVISTCINESAERYDLRLFVIEIKELPMSELSRWR